MTADGTGPNIDALQDNLQDLQDLVITQASKLINSNLYTKSLLSSLPVALISTDQNGKIQVANKAAEEMLQTSLQTLRGKSLTDAFEKSAKIAATISEAEEQQASCSETSLELFLEPGKHKIVDIHVRPFYDEERKVFGTLIAIEDQTYISFLRESFQQHTPTPPDEAIIAQSPKMKQVMKKMSGLAENDNMTLFIGPSGSGKTFFASKLHKRRFKDQKAPFITLDCRNSDLTKFKELLFGSGDTSDDDKDLIRFKSIEDYGTVHLAEGGTLLLRNIDCLTEDNFESLEDYLTGVNQGSSSLPVCHIMATSKVEPSDLKKREDGAHPFLVNLLANSIQIPSLQKRKKDILPLAKLFLENLDSEKNYEISGGAENGLLSKDYAQNNVKELKDAIDLAVVISDGEVIRSEHIFTGPMEQENEYEFDLTQLKLVKFLVNDRTLSVLQGVVLSFFLLIIGSTLFFPENLPGIISNSLVWGAWWVFLVIGFLLLGRVWCTICPLSTVGRLMKRFWHFDKSPPGTIKDRAAFIIPIGFVIIIWLEHSFHMISSPRPTGFLLIGLIILAALFAILYERETWCRYVCPLGNFGSIFSLSATLFVRSNPNVCATKCTTHNCNKGSDEYAGCPVFHHPLFARNSHICKLCFNCIKSCPHGSARLYFRPPLVRIWQQVDIAETLTFFAIVLFLIAPVVLGSESIPVLVNSKGFSLAVLLCMLVAFLLQFTLPTFLFGKNEKKVLQTTRIGLVLLLLAWGPFAAFQIGHIPELDSLYITPGSGALSESIIGNQGVPLLALVQLSAIWFGMFLAAITLIGLRWSSTGETISALGRKSYLIYIVGLVYPVINSLIIL